MHGASCGCLEAARLRCAEEPVWAGPASHEADEVSARARSCEFGGCSFRKRSGCVCVFSGGGPAPAARVKRRFSLPLSSGEKQSLTTSEESPGSPVMPGVADRSLGLLRPAKAQAPQIPDRLCAHANRDTCTSSGTRRVRSSGISSCWCSLVDSFETRGAAEIAAFGVRSSERSPPFKGA